MTDREPPDGDEIEIELRSPAEVGRRIVVLSAICRRAFLESAPTALELDEDIEAERFDLTAWLEERRLFQDATIVERRLLSAPAGTLTSTDTHWATWTAEAVAALAWATRLLTEIADPVALADLRPLLQQLPAPWDETDEFLARIALRSESEIEQERERAEVWLWRADLESERRTASNQDRREFDAEIRDVVRECVAAGLLPPSATSDFVVAGRPFRSLDLDDVEQVANMASVRLHALNWLCGFGTSWDDVPLDVG